MDEFREYLRERAENLRREAIKLERIIALLDDFEFSGVSPSGPYPVRSRGTYRDEVYDAVRHFLEGMPDGGFPVTTRFVARALRWGGLSMKFRSLLSATSAALRRLEDEGEIVRTGHGKWARASITDARGLS